jgi:hypothetical protein
VVVTLLWVVVIAAFVIPMWRAIPGQVRRRRQVGIAQASQKTCPSCGVAGRCVPAQTNAPPTSKWAGPFALSMGKLYRCEACDYKFN